MNNDPPKLTKRPFDDRIMSVNLGPVMRDNDTISLISSITSTTGITISNITHTSGIVFFLVSGGNDGISYPVTIQFSTNSNPTQNLETVVQIVVSD